MKPLFFLILTILPLSCEKEDSPVFTLTGKTFSGYSFTSVVDAHKIYVGYRFTSEKDVTYLLLEENASIISQEQYTYTLDYPNVLLSNGGSLVFLDENRLQAGSVIMTIW